MSPLNRVKEIAAEAGLACEYRESSLFRVGDIKDWALFLPRLITAKNAGRPNPGKRIWALLPPEIQMRLGNHPSVANQKKATPSVRRSGNVKKEEKASVVDALNHVLDQRNFYQEQDFSSLALPEKAQELLNRARDGLSTGEVRQLNRLLIQAAYPHEITKAQHNEEHLYFRVNTTPHSSAFTDHPSRGQAVLAKVQGKTPDGNTVIGFYSLCEKIDRDTIMRFKNNDELVMFLRRNANLFFGSFALLAVNKDEYLCIKESHILETMDARELKNLVHAVCHLADAFETERGKDHF